MCSQCSHRTIYPPTASNLTHQILFQTTSITYTTSHPLHTFLHLLTHSRRHSFLYGSFDLDYLLLECLDLLHHLLMFEEKKEAHFVDFVYFEGIAGSFMASGKLGLEVRGKAEELFVVHFTSNIIIK